MQTAGIDDLQVVVVHGDAHRTAGDGVVAVAEGIGDGLAGRTRRISVTPKSTKPPMPLASAQTVLAASVRWPVDRLNSTRSDSPLRTIVFNSFRFTPRALPIATRGSRHERG